MNRVALGVLHLVKFSLTACLFLQLFERVVYGIVDLELLAVQLISRNVCLVLNVVDRRVVRRRLFRALGLHLAATVAVSSLDELRILASFDTF